MRSLACLALLLFASPAIADDGNRCVQGDKQPVKIKVERQHGRNVTVIQDDIIVCGHPPRPSVVYVVTPKSINYEWESLKQEFLPQTLASVTKAPF